MHAVTTAHNDEYASGYSAGFHDALADQHAMVRTILESLHADCAIQITFVTNLELEFEIIQSTRRYKIQFKFDSDRRINDIHIKESS